MSVQPAQPALRREPEGAVIGGVCAGLARRFGIPPLFFRIAFLAASVGGLGIGLYALAWLLMPGEGARGRLALRLPGGRASWQVAAGMALLVGAVLLLFRQWGIWIGDALVWPVVLAAVGGALIWRQSSPAPGHRGPAAIRLPPDAFGRIALGAALVVGGGLVFLYLNDALAPARDVILAMVVVLVALSLILAPFWLRLGRHLAEERNERIRSQERADIAAHLHDSVLQTLALMQKRADDPRAVAGLARRQERELRAWLSGGRPPGSEATLAAALEAAAAEVEADHGVPVDVVAVGDAPLGPGAEALVAAAREALVNAAKFAGGPISVYAEASPERLQVFVRDRGPGFDPDAVPEDRRGLRESIVGRMARHGGRATVHTGAGAGTEIELTLEAR